MKSKKLIFSIVILIIILCFAMFFIFTKDNTKNINPSTNTTTTDSQNNTNNNSGNENEASNPSTETPIETDNNEQHQDDEQGSSEEHTHLAADKTIFDITEDTAKLIPYSLTKPSVLKDVTLNSVASTLIDAANGQLIVYVDEESLEHYDLNQKQVNTIGQNVTQVKSTDNIGTVVYERQDSKGYHTYQYEYKDKNYGPEEFSLQKNRLVDFGKIQDMVFFKNKENPTTYFYFAGPRSSFESEEKGFQNINNIEKISQWNKNIVAYKAEDNSIYTGAIGQALEKQSTLPKTESGTIKFLTPNPFSKDKLNLLVGMGSASEAPVADVLIWNNNVLKDVSSVNDIAWIDEDSFIYTESSYENYMYLYNTKASTKTLLAISVSSMTFDADTKTIYFNAGGDDKVRKIEIKK